MFISTTNVVANTFAVIFKESIGLSTVTGTINER